MIKDMKKYLNKLDWKKFFLFEKKKWGGTLKKKEKH